MTTAWKSIESSVARLIKQMTAGCKTAAWKNWIARRKLRCLFSDSWLKKSTAYRMLLAYTHTVYQNAFAEFRTKGSFLVELAKLYRRTVDVCEMFRFSRNKLFVARSFCSGRIWWDEKVTLTLFSASALFGRVNSSLQLEFRLLRSINKGGYFSCVLKFEHSLLVRSCDVLEALSPLVFQVGSLKEYFLIL